MIRVTTRGVAAVKAKLVETRQRYIDAFEAAQFLVGQDLMTKFAPGFPVETGALAESRAVTRTLPVRLVVGAMYAVYAHARGRKKRWLQVPFSRASPQIAAKIARATMRAYRERLTLSSAPAEHPETPQQTPVAHKRGPRKRQPPRRRAKRKARAPRKTGFPGNSA